MATPPCTETTQQLGPARSEKKTKHEHWLKGHDVDAETIIEFTDSKSKDGLNTLTNKNVNISVLVNRICAQIFKFYTHVNHRLQPKCL